MPTIAEPTYMPDRKCSILVVNKHTALSLLWQLCSCAELPRPWAAPMRCPAGPDLECHVMRPPETQRRADEAS